MKRLRIIVIAGTLGLLPLSGCGDSEPTTDGRQDERRQDDLPRRNVAEPTESNSPTTAAPTEGTPVNSASPAPEAGTATEATSSDAPVDDESDRPAYTYAFVMPSTNVVCAISDATAQCTIFERDYQPAAEAVDGTSAGGCSPSEATTLALTAGQIPVWRCADSRLLDEATIGESGSWASAESERVRISGEEYAQLPYDRSLSSGSISCLSDNEGVVCTDDSGHGFRLATASYDRY